MKHEKFLIDFDWKETLYEADCFETTSRASIEFSDDTENVVLEMDLSVEVKASYEKVYLSGPYGSEDSGTRESNVDCKAHIHSMTLFGCPATQEQIDLAKKLIEKTIIDNATPDEDEEEPEYDEDDY